jgi:hypothetical protein
VKTSTRTKTDSLARRLPVLEAAVKPVPVCDLALREISDNVAVTKDRVTAWFTLAAQRWAWLSDDTRKGLLSDTASAYATLAGHSIHLRVTAKPYPGRVWAQQILDRTPNPLPSFGDRVTRTQNLLLGQSMAEKVVYLGIDIERRDFTGKAAAAVRDLASSPRDFKAIIASYATGGSGDSELHRITVEAQRMARNLAYLGAKACTPQEVEWLVHRSVGLSLPAQQNPSPTPGGALSDMAQFSDGVVAVRDPFDETTELRLRSARTKGGRPVSRHVAVLTLGPSDAVDPHSGLEPWMAIADRLPFTVEWYSHLNILSGPVVKKRLDRVLRWINGQREHFAEHPSYHPPRSLLDAGQQALDIEDETYKNDPSIAARGYGWHYLMVSGKTREECLSNVQVAQTLYMNELKWTLVHPKNQYALYRSFIPGEPLGSKAHLRHFPLRMVTAGLPTVTSDIGDRRGAYLGTTAGTRHAVLVDLLNGPEYLDASGLWAFIGGLGSGKSGLIGKFAAWYVERRIPVTIFDPSGPLAKLCDLPWLPPGSAMHFDLTKAPPGTLNPYGVIADPRKENFTTDPDVLRAWDNGEQARARTLALLRHAEAVEETAADRRQLVRDIVYMLIDPATKKNESTADVVGDAIVAVPAVSTSTLWDLIRELERHADPHGRKIANQLRATAGMRLTRLFFPPEHDEFVQVPIDDPILLVITMPGLTLPLEGTDPEQWTAEERASVPALHLAAHLASRRAYNENRLKPKVVFFDEVGQLGEWGSGRALFVRMGRDTRKWTLAVGVADQNPAGIMRLGDQVGNLLAGVFVGRIGDDETASAALKLLNSPRGIGYERVLRRLSPPSPPGSREDRRRSYVLRIGENVEKIHVTFDVDPDVLAVLRSGKVGSEPAPAPATPAETSLYEEGVA